MIRIQKKSLSQDMSFSWKSSFPFPLIYLKTLSHVGSLQPHISKRHPITQPPHQSTYLVSEPTPPVSSLVPMPLPLSNQPMTSHFAPQQDDPFSDLTSIIAPTLELAKNNFDCHSSTPSTVNTSSNPNHSHSPVPPTTNTHQMQSRSKIIFTSLILNILFKL